MKVQRVESVSTVYTKLEFHHRTNLQSCIHVGNFFAISKDKSCNDICRTQAEGEMNFVVCL